MFSRNVTKSLTALGVVLAAFGLSLASTTSASAADDGTGEGKLTLSPASGTWASGNPPGGPVPNTSLEANFSCPAGSEYLVYFITEPGTELPDVTDSTEIRSKYPISNYNYAESYYSPAFTPRTAPISTYSYYATSTEDLPDVRTALQANHDYSFGLVCAKVNSSYQLVFSLQDGKPVAVWTAFNTDAEKNWTAPAPKADTTVKLTGKANGSTENDLSAEVDSEAVGGLATDAKGSIEFFSDGLSIGSAAVANGKASFKHTGLSAATAYKYTAKYTPSAEDTSYKASELSPEITVSTGTSTASPTTSAPTISTPTNSSTPTSSETTTITSNPSSSSPSDGGSTPVSTLVDGGTIEPGKTYTVLAPTGSFTADDTVHGAIHSEPINLNETSTAAADGSTVYTFTAPQVLPAGDHQLVLTGTPSEKSYTLNVKIVAPGASGNTPNDPFTPLTAWAASAISTPGGIAGLFALALGVAAAVALGWNLLLKRRPARQH